ncbi:hypothetical protein TRFO_22337 [Tritrichomonas foetus]|uniref:Uncharacterized protein n=1 Tax=Tritrichomonas foetus TaxID=1144522 RepID=A0A1J4KBY8_9EUKA|nr:hypothetical protein TRFO_22337 [Tritrichomonas foetus]|eukprot:OHT08929.1 hypothetical protein TRFO_22337 [Tritrichomonas foetus]
MQNIPNDDYFLNDQLKPYISPLNYIGYLNHEEIDKKMVKHFSSASVMIEKYISQSETRYQQLLDELIALENQNLHPSSLTITRFNVKFWRLCVFLTFKLVKYQFRSIKIQIPELEKIIEKLKELNSFAKSLQKNPKMICFSHSKIHYLTKFNAPFSLTFKINSLQAALSDVKSAMTFVPRVFTKHTIKEYFINLMLSAKKNVDPVTHYLKEMIEYEDFVDFIKSRYSPLVRVPSLAKMEITEQIQTSCQILSNFVEIKKNEPNLNSTQNKNENNINNESKNIDNKNNESRDERNKNEDDELISIIGNFCTRFWINKNVLIEKYTSKSNPEFWLFLDQTSQQLSKFTFSELSNLTKQNNENQNSQINVNILKSLLPPPEIEFLFTQSQNNQNKEETLIGFIQNNELLGRAIEQLWQLIFLTNPSDIAYQIYQINLRIFGFVASVKNASIDATSVKSGADYLWELLIINSNPPEIDGIFAFVNEWKDEKFSITELFSSIEVPLHALNTLLELMKLNKKIE